MLPFLRRFVIVTLSVAYFGFSHAQNAIVTENTLAGTPIATWGVPSFRDTHVNGFATDISVNKGNRVHFKINIVGASTFTLQIYRLGYYGGNGACLKADLGTLPGVAQPAGVQDAVTGLLDCSNWSESAHWDVPANAVSGFYIAKIVSSTGSNHIVFTVRDDASHSDIYFQTADATWQAYNGYGGNNLYNGTTNLPNGHASKVSYNRPFFVYNANFAVDGRGSDWYMNDAYPMIRWLERNGYDVSYTTSIDVARFGNLILNHKLFLTVGHDEYWSKIQRDNVEAARSAGVHLAFFTGNDVYWKTRWEADAGGNSYRTLVCYKEGLLGDGSQGEASCGNKCDASTNEWTGLWRTGAAYDAPLPENALTGEIGWQQTNNTSIQVPDTYKNLRFWRNTSVAALGTGQIATLGVFTLGYEWNYEQYPGFYPNGRITLSSTTINGFTHKLSLYKYSSGAWVFGAGTVQWSWGLDDQHFGGTGNVVSKDIQQATLNLFADMGIQPGSKQSDLVAATASTDVTPPASKITSPANGSSIAINGQVVISGTASDAQAVAGVEVSVDGGLTWKVATGTNNWSFSWIPPGPGNYIIKSRGYDDSGNMEATAANSGPNVINLTLTPGVCPCHIFTTQTPVSTTNNDNTPIEMGVKFHSSAIGFISGIRFYKTTGNTGTHIGELYSQNGTRLAQATFTNETATGWQEVLFSTPVSIAANTTYIAAYYSSLGNYVEDNGYFFTDSVHNSPLTALKDGVDGGNGVYKYTNTPAFPTDIYKQANYWVDVVFNANTTPIANAGSNQIVTLPASSTTLDGSGSSGNITSYAWTLVSGPNTPTLNSPSSISTGVTGLVKGTYVFQLSVNAGASTSQVTVNVVTGATTIFTTQTPTSVTSNDGQGIELGIKFRSSSSGSVAGVRFYKTAGNTGTHTGELYSSTGTRLAQATFTSESATGWQQVLFSSPVAITANTTYIAAYHSSAGNYTGQANYFTAAVVNSPLTGLANGTDGPNGVYNYSPTPVFPNSSPGNSPNYWVDVVLLNAANGALPVQLTSFTAIKQGENALLKWTTASEQNNKGFEIQRSNDASNWSTIGFTNGAGNSQANINYQFTDKIPGTGKIYYRLRQVDFDGNYKLSDVVYVTFTDKLVLELQQNHPNPFNTTTTIDISVPFAGRIKLMLYDQMGRPIKQLLDEVKSPGIYQIQMNRTGLSAGIYYYKLDSKDQTLIKKMTIL